LLSSGICISGREKGIRRQVWIWGRRTGRRWGNFDGAMRAQERVNVLRDRSTSRTMLSSTFHHLFFHNFVLRNTSQHVSTHTT
jgi:hypothetical protein